MAGLKKKIKQKDVPALFKLNSDYADSETPTFVFSIINNNL